MTLVRRGRGNVLSAPPSSVESAPGRVVVLHPRASGGCAAATSGGTQPLA